MAISSEARPDPAPSGGLARPRIRSARPEAAFPPTRGLRQTNCLRQARLAREWSQRDVAEMVGVRRATISDIENAVKRPTAELMERIARAFGVPQSELFHWVEE